MEKVARGRQDAMQSKEITEALQCLLNGWFVVEFLQSFCETLHSDVVAVRLQGHKGALASRSDFWLQVPSWECACCSLFPSRLTSHCLSPSSLWVLLSPFDSVGAPMCVGGWWALEHGP